MFIEQRFISSHTIKLYTDASSEIGFAAVFWKEVGSRSMAQSVYFVGYHPSSVVPLDSGDGIVRPIPSQSLYTFHV